MASPPTVSGPAKYAIQVFIKQMCIDTQLNMYRLVLFSVYIYSSILKIIYIFITYILCVYICTFVYIKGTPPTDGCSCIFLNIFLYIY